MNITKLLLALSIGFMSLTLGNAQQLVSNPSSVNFGIVSPNSKNTIDISLTNTGTSALTVSGITVSGSGFSGGGVNSGENFPAGGGSAYGVTFVAPATGGPFTGTITITSNGPTVTIPLSASFAGTTTPPTGTINPPYVTLSCTPSEASTTSNPGTVTMLRSVGSSTTFTSLVTGLAPNCAYTDSAVTNGNTYNYEAEFVQNGETSGPSNTFTATIQSIATTPTVSVVASATSPVSNTAVQVTVSVTGTGTTPTGSIVLTGAGYTSASSILTNGTVVITIPINSLTTGASNFVATYTPDASSSTVYNTATGSEAVIVIPAAPSTLSGTTTN